MTDSGNTADMAVPRDAAGFESYAGVGGGTLRLFTSESVTDDW